MIYVCAYQNLKPVGIPKGSPLMEILRDFQDLTRDLPFSDLVTVASKIVPIRIGLEYEDYLFHNAQYLKMKAYLAKKNEEANNSVQ